VGEGKSWGVKKLGRNPKKGPICRPGGNYISFPKGLFPRNLGGIYAGGELNRAGGIKGEWGGQKYWGKTAKIMRKRLFIWGGGILILKQGKGGTILCETP